MTTGELGNQISDLAVQIGILTDSVNQLGQTVQSQIAETREQRQVAELQSQNIQSLSNSVAQLISLAQQQQSIIDRLLSSN